jgi:retron-type reverse transcriptase
MTPDLRFAYSLGSLAVILGCTAKQLGFYVYGKPLSKQYKQFEIKKRRGGSRRISAPSTNLKIIQKSISRELEKLRSFHSSAHGFMSGRSIQTNANPHVDQRTVLNIDLEDFFGSINFGRVYGLLSKAPYNLADNVAAVIAKACTYENKLPQGAPSSPILSNMICSKMDAELARLARVNRCIYTRYADDITFSTSAKMMPLARKIVQLEQSPTYELSHSLQAIIESNGFRVNGAKTRVYERTDRQEVTGLIVNKRLNVKRRSVREARAMLHAWRRHGFAAAQQCFAQKYNGQSSNFENVLRGKITFIGQIRGRPDSVFRKLANQFNQLTTGSKIRTQLTPSELVDRAVWVIESDETTQGTAFLAEHYGWITCSHCLGENAFIYHPSDHTKKFPVTVLAKDNHRDLAALRAPQELDSIGPIPIAEASLPTSGSAVELRGYPAHHAARPIRPEKGTLIRSFPRSGVSYLEITPKIMGGNSGGPILNEKHEVIGIAVLGLNGEVDMKATEFLGVSSIELKHLAPAN